MRPHPEQPRRLLDGAVLPVHVAIAFRALGVRRRSSRCRGGRAAPRSPATALRSSCTRNLGSVAGGAAQARARVAAAVQGAQRRRVPERSSTRRKGGLGPLHRAVPVASLRAQARAGAAAVRRSASIAALSGQRAASTAEECDAKVAGRSCRNDRAQAPRRSSDGIFDALHGHWRTSPTRSACRRWRATSAHAHPQARGGALPPRRPRRVQPRQVDVRERAARRGRPAGRHHADHRDDQPPRLRRQAARDAS